MRLGEAFTTRDQMNKQALFDEFGKDRLLQTKINAAFKEGERRWRENLSQVFGERRASKIIEMLSAPVE